MVHTPRPAAPPAPKYAPKQTYQEPKKVEYKKKAPPPLPQKQQGPTGYIRPKKQVPKTPKPLPRTPKPLPKQSPPKKPVFNAPKKYNPPKPKKTVAPKKPSYPLPKPSAQNYQVKKPVNKPPPKPAYPLFS